MKMHALFSTALLFSAAGLITADESALHELQTQTRQAEMYMHAMGAVAALTELNRRAAAAEKHRAYMVEHEEVVSGGNGVDVAHAIVLNTASQKERSAELVEEQGKQIEAYVSAVYPQCNRGYTFRIFTPDGASYVVFMFYAGLCADEDGQYYLINLPIYFRTKEAGL